jgi:DNA-binding NtrC family response regulator
VTLGGETLGVEDLPQRIQRAEPGPAPALPSEPTTLAELERRHVEAVLEHSGGDRRKAAEVLGIDLSTLYRKLKRWNEAGDT